MNRWLTFHGVDVTYRRFACVPIAVLLVGLIVDTSIAVPLGKISNIEFTNDSVTNESTLNKVFIDDGRVQGPSSGPIGGLIGIEIFHYFASNTPSGTTQSIVSPKTDAVSNPNSIPAGSRTNLLDDDDTLNTGILNVAKFGGSPGIAKNLPVTAAALAMIPGLGITFDSPVINGPGDDIVLMDIRFAPNPASGDPFYVTGIFQGVSTGVTTAPIASTDYIPTPFLLPSQARAYSLSNPLENLSKLDNNTIMSAMTITPTLYVVSFNLDAVGVDLGAAVTGLFIQSSTQLIDPVYIAGLTPVPEPSSSTIMLSAFVVAAWIRSRPLGLVIRWTFRDDSTRS